MVASVRVSVLRAHFRGTRRNTYTHKRARAHAHIHMHTCANKAHLCRIQHMTQDSYTSINDVTVKVYVCWNTANVNRYSLQLLVHIPYSDPLMSHTIQRLHEQVKDERARRAADKVACVHVCVCACVCVCVCVCVHASTHTHTHTNTHTHTHTND